MKILINHFLIVIFSMALYACTSNGLNDGLEQDNSLHDESQRIELINVSDSIITIDQSQMGSYAFSEKTYKVVQDEEYFQDLWKELNSNKHPLPELPEIDFSEYTILASMMGIQKSGGYTIEIVDVGKKDGEIGVKIEEREPGAGCITATVLTAPYHIVKILKQSDYDFKFTTRRNVFECNS
jgi:hypothetical protein